LADSDAPDSLRYQRKSVRGLAQIRQSHRVLQVKRERRPVVIAGAGFLLALTAYVVFDRFFARSALPEGLIQVNGRIEGDHVTVASKFPGRIDQLLAREGDDVTASQTLVRLEDAQIAARVEQARSAVAVVDAQIQAAHTALAMLNREVPLAIEWAQAQVASTEAAVEKAIAVAQEARSDAQRFRELAATNRASLQQRDQAITRWEVAQRDIAYSRSTLTQATKELAQAELGWERIRVTEADMDALERQRDQSSAALAEAESVLADLTIKAPTDGTITTRMVNSGEVVAAGAPLLEIVDLDRLYLQVYVPAVQIGKIRLGLPARIHIDAFPDQAFDATVRYISSKAEFTPKEVQTADERVKLIYAVRLYLTANPDRRLTPGLPADAVIRWRDDVEWVAARR
jgi:HlyD family secretion protein